ncbi:MAG: A/G-specific adenine glycosylase, partial [Verrucomicrobia bacterium]|nr:A/G-specific adenine glycosylase [Verrucomicrobiota bacterium]
MQNLIKSSWAQSEPSKKTFRKSLLLWFDQQKRELPWRDNPSLYKTVVSEFMLQQTRVTTMLPYFENWMNQFPDFEILANAPETKILKAWEGLGYYSRAKNLHKLAKIIQNWTEPQKSLDEWKKLPGVGPYIAAAITSISL